MKRPTWRLLRRERRDARAEQAAAADKHAAGWGAAPTGLSVASSAPPGPQAAQPGLQACGALSCCASPGGREGDEVFALAVVRSDVPSDPHVGHRPWFSTLDALGLGWESPTAQTASPRPHGVRMCRPVSLTVPAVCMGPRHPQTHSNAAWIGSLSHTRCLPVHSAGTRMTLRGSGCRPPSPCSLSKACSCSSQARQVHGGGAMLPPRCRGRTGCHKQLQDAQPGPPRPTRGPRGAQEAVCGLRR